MATVSGQVTNAVTREPVRKAIVRMVGAGGGVQTNMAGPRGGLVPGGPPDRAGVGFRGEGGPMGAPTGGPRQYVAEADAAGNFEIGNVAPGTYRLIATRTGFVGGSRDRNVRSPKQVTITVASDAVRGVQVELMPAGVVAGRITDEDGDPVQYATVQVLRWVYREGKRQLAQSGNDQSNDLGEYRISGIEPGSYLLSVSRGRTAASMLLSNQPDAERAEYEYSPVFYPAALHAEAASPVQVKPGVEMRGMDLRLQKARVFRVRGKVGGFLATADTGRGPMGPRGVMLSLQQNSMLAGMRSIARPTGVRRDGTFEIQGVRPGTYMLTAHQGSRETMLTARLPITVGDADLSGVELHLQPNAKLKGIVSMEGEQTPLTARMSVQLRSQEEGVSESRGARVNAEDGSFEVTVPAGQYRLFVQPAPEGYYLKSVRWGEQEVSESGFMVVPNTAGTLNVVLRPGAASISGTVRGGDDQPLGNAIVTLAPTGGRASIFELYRYTTASETGEFQLTGLSPGSYKVHAWEALENGMHTDPDFLRSFESAGMSVTLKEGARETLQLGAIPASAVQGQ